MTFGALDDVGSSLILPPDLKSGIFSSIQSCENFSGFLAQKLVVEDETVENSPVRIGSVQFQ